MADIAELLSQSNPEKLKQLLDLRDKLGALSPPAPSVGPTEYINSPVFQKQVAQDVVNQASLPGKSAADSAEVFSKMAPEAEEMLPALGREAVAAAPSMLSKLGRLASKAAGPLGLAYTALESQPGHSDEEELAARDALIAQQSQQETPIDLKQMMGKYLALSQPQGPQGIQQPQTQDIQTMGEGIGSLPPIPSEVPYAGRLQQAQAYLDKAKSSQSSPSLKSPVSSSNTESFSQPSAPASTPSNLMSLLGMSPQMLDAIKTRNANQSIAGIGKAANQFGSALSRGTAAPNQEVFNDINKQSEQPVTDVETQSKLGTQALAQRESIDKLDQSNRMSDPNSDISKAAREFYQKMSHKAAPPGMSAADLEKMEPVLGKVFAAEEAAKGRANALQVAQLNKDAMIGLRKDALDLRTNTAGNSIATKETSDYTGLLDAATTANDLIDKVISKDLKSTTTVRNAITTDLTRLLTRMKQTAVNDRDASAVDTLYGRVKDFESKYGSTPINTVPRAYLDQFKKEVEILNESLWKNYATKTNELMSAAASPKQAEVFSNRFNTQAKSRGIDGRKLLELNGGQQTPSLVKDLSDKTSSMSEAPKQIKVTNGSETRSIDPSDLEHAIADGYKQVE